MAGGRNQSKVDAVKTKLGAPLCHVVVVVDVDVHVNAVLGKLQQEPEYVHAHVNDQVLMEAIHDRTCQKLTIICGNHEYYAYFLTVLIRM